jgi:hypothetical protein
MILTAVRLIVKLFVHSKNVYIKWIKYNDANLNSTILGLSQIDLFDLSKGL